MTIPRWLDWDLFPGSACKEFLLQLTGEGVTSGSWKGRYLGGDLFPNWEHLKKHYTLNPDGSCEIDDPYRLYGDTIDKWAKKFLLFYDEGEKKLLFDVDNRDGSKRIDLSIAVDWGRFCEVWNHGGISFGIGNFDPSPLSDMMFNDRRLLSWDDKLKQITVHFENGAEIAFTPSAFVRQAVDVTANRFKREFGSWEWIFQKSDEWMKVVSDWEEFNDLLKKPHTTEYQVDQLQKSYDSSHGDFYQTELKITFDDGSALYGVADGVSDNYPFVKQLSFRGDFDDDRYKFSLPVPLLMSNLWY